MSLCALTICLALAPQSPGSGPTDATADRAAVTREIRYIPIREWVAPSPTPLLPRLGSFLGARQRISEPVLLLGPGDVHSQ